MTAPLRDEDLHAYVDGQLSEQERSRLERHLAQNAEDAARAADYRRLNEEIAALYAPVAVEPVPERLVAAVARRRGRGPSWRRMAAALGWLAVGLAAGSGFGWWMWGAGGPGGADRAMAELVRPAVMAHAVFVTEVRHPVEVGRDQRDHLVQWLSNRLGSRIRAPDLARQGFELMGGRLLPGTDGPAAQLMYNAAGGERLTIYVRVRSRDTGETAFQYQSSASGTAAIFWIDGTLGWVVAGALPRERLEAVADAVYEQLGP